MFQVSINSNNLYIPPTFHICTVAIKTIRNMHAVSLNQIEETLHFNDNTCCSSSLITVCFN